MGTEDLSPDMFYEVPVTFQGLECATRDSGNTSGLYRFEKCCYTNPQDRRCDRSPERLIHPEITALNNYIKVIENHKKNQ